MKRNKKLATILIIALVVIIALPVISQAGLKGIRVGAKFPPPDGNKMKPTDPGAKWPPDPTEPNVVVGGVVAKKAALAGPVYYVREQTEVSVLNSKAFGPAQMTADMQQVFDDAFIQGYPIMVACQQQDTLCSGKIKGVIAANIDLMDESFD